MRILFLILFFSSCFYSNAQITQITGTLTDEFDNSVSNASVIVLNTNSELVKAFSISKSDGKYTLNFDLKADSLLIRITHISHKKVEQKIANTSQTINFKLESEVQLLEEIVFKRQNEISKKGDTISYDVATFKSQKDRVIADVLSKLPGIEVEPDGKVLYQGKPIEKYYIEGLDLLEGKYDLANKNIPADAVEKVEILENHQPIKALDSLTFSNNTSLNIKLKKGITTTGTAKLGTGITENHQNFIPFLWDTNLTPMFFGKKNQLIASYQTNNTGNDVSAQLRAFTLEDFIANSQIPKKIDWLSVQKLNTPNFTQNRWLNNQIHMFSFNFLKKLKNDYQLKTNVSYFHDTQKQFGNTQTTVFLPTSEINILENTQNRFINNELEAKFILTKNSKKNYLKNELEIKRQWNNQNGAIQREEQNTNLSISQQVLNPFTEISNTLNWIFPAKSIKKSSLNFNSIINYQNHVPNFEVNPVVFPNLIANYTVFNSTDSLKNYDRIIQYLNQTTFFTQNSISFSKKIKKISFSPKIGIQTNYQKLESNIDILKKDTSFEENFKNFRLSNEFQNRLSFAHYTVFTEIGMQYQKKNWKINFDVPLRLHYFQINKNIENENQNENIERITFEPNLKIVKELNGYWKFVAGASRKNNFGSINQLYQGYVLQNYRSIIKNDVPLKQDFNQSLNAGFNYKNPITSIFFNGFYMYNYQKTNLIWQNEFDDTGTAILKGILRTNYASTHTANTTINKYFYKIKTTFMLNSTYSFSQNLAFINQELNTIQNQNIAFRGKINTDFSKYFGLTYSNRFSFMNAVISTEKLNTIEQQNHQIAFSIYPNERNYISLKADFYQNKIKGTNAVTQNSRFLDMLYRYTFLKKSIDLEFSLTNILNTKQFVNISNSSFFYTQTVFDLRPRQVLASVRFKF
jgi:hypothetical protein